MIRRITQASIRNLIKTQSSIVQRYQSSSVATQNKWDLCVGVLVERLPVVSKTLSQIERDFQDLLLRVEYENSLKSNFELQHERDLAQAELFKKGNIEIELDESVSKQTAQDLKDVYTEELKQFQFAPRTTPDDTSGKVTSTNRKLEDILYLLVQQKIGEHQHFLLPQGERQEGETMLQTAERIVREKCGDQLKVRFYGNAPVGFYKYKYPKSLRNVSQGAKIFFYRAQLCGGNVNKAKETPKYGWLTKSELDDSLKNAIYAESIKRFLLE